MLLPTESTAAGSPVVCPLRSSCGSAPSASHGLCQKYFPVHVFSQYRMAAVSAFYEYKTVILYREPVSRCHAGTVKSLIGKCLSRCKLRYDFRQKSFIVHISAGLASALLRPKCRRQKKIIHMDHISAQFFCKSGSQCCLPCGASAVNGNNAHSGGKHTQFLCQLRNSSQRSHPQPPQCILPGVCSRLPR